MVPTEAGGYALSVDDGGRKALGLVDNDPLVAGIQEQFLKSGRTQGQFDDFMKTAGELAEAGLFGTGAFDPAAEAAKLGENADGRRREVEIFAEALKARGQGFDDEMYGELMGLSPTAAGVKLVEFLRGAMGEAGRIDPPDAPSDGGEATVEKAKAMARDARYGVDAAYTKEADDYWQKAHRKR